MRAYYEDLSREKAVTKTITLRVRVKTTEFAVLADALGGTLKRECIDGHGCRSAEVTACMVNGREVKWGAVNRGTAKPKVRELTCLQCGSASLRANKDDGFTCRKCGAKDVVRL